MVHRMLQRRHPYAAPGDFFFLDMGSKDDGTPGRQSTFLNAHRRLKMFTGRSDPAGKPEQALNELLEIGFERRPD